MPETGQWRTARWRLRQGGLPDPYGPQLCSCCGRQVRSGSNPLCSRCRRGTDAGRQANRERMRAARQALASGRLATNASKASS